ncbi:MAG TPA: DUF6544 family protein [Patescibacteria group bacterium]|nr:DUF6544 family protein [Patescibacteria group bacterium]
MARPASRTRFDELVEAEFAAQPLAPARTLGEDDLMPLPRPVQRYVRASGAVGRPRPQNVRIEFDAAMRRKPGEAGMVATSVQYNFFGRPARVFFMTARVFGLPVRALHVYRHEEATFTVRVASLVNMVDQDGDEISRAETVTVLNDLCVFAPGALADPRLSWQPLDDRSAVVTFTNGPYRVAATLLFNERDELVDFWSDDRPDSSSGSFIPMRWNTPVGDHREIGGLRVPTRGSTVYARPDGPFTYGEFTLRSIFFDLSVPRRG